MKYVGTPIKDGSTVHPVQQNNAWVIKGWQGQTFCWGQSQADLSLGSYMGKRLNSGRCESNFLILIKNKDKWQFILRYWHDLKKKEGRHVYCKIMQHQLEACVTQLI